METVLAVESGRDAVARIRPARVARLDRRRVGATSSDAAETWRWLTLALRRR